MKKIGYLLSLVSLSMSLSLFGDISALYNDSVNNNEIRFVSSSSVLPCSPKEEFLIKHVQSSIFAADIGQSKLYQDWLTSKKFNA